MLSAYVNSARRGCEVLARSNGLAASRNTGMLNHLSSSVMHRPFPVTGARRCLATQARAAPRKWVEERLKGAKKFLDHNPFVKLSLYGTAVFMTFLATLDYMMKGKKKAGPKEVSILPFDCGGYLLQRTKEVEELLALCRHFELSWQGSVRLVGVDGAAMCGKTELLRQFAQAWSQKEGSGWLRSYLPTVLTFEAHDIDDMVVQLHHAASRLGCLASDVVEGDGGGDAFAQLTPDQQVGCLCLAIKSKLRERGHWLIVVDGDVAQRCLMPHLPLDGSQDWGKGVVVVAGSNPAAELGASAPVYQVPECLSMSQSLDLILSSCTPHHSQDLLRVDLGSSADQLTSDAKELCERVGHIPMAVALAGSLIRWRHEHGQKGFWFAECAELIEERCRKLAADAEAAGRRVDAGRSSALALVAVTEILAEDILSAGQQPNYQQSAGQGGAAHSFSSDTMVREVLAALGWLGGDRGPVAVAFLRQHMQHHDFDLERAREQQVLQQRQELEAMRKMAETPSKSTSSSTPDVWTTMKSALPFGLGQSASSSAGEEAATGPSSPTQQAPVPGAAAAGAAAGMPDVVDDTLDKMREYHLVRRSDVSDCAVLRTNPLLASAVRHDYLLRGAERAEQRHVNRESTVASMKTQRGYRMNRFDAGRCRMDYRKTLQAQLDRHHGRNRPSSRLVGLLKSVDALLEEKVPDAAFIRTNLLAAVTSAGTPSTASKDTATAATPAAAKSSAAASPAASPAGDGSHEEQAVTMTAGECVRQLDELRGNVAAPSSADTFLRLHRHRLLSAVGSAVDTCPGTVSGRVLRRYAMAAHARLHHGARLDGGRDLWPGVSEFTVGELGRVLSLRGQVMTRCYHLHSAGVAMLRQSAELSAKAYGERSAATLNSLNLLSAELRLMSNLGATTVSSAEVETLLGKVVDIEDTISPMTVTPEQASVTAGTLYLLARCQADQGQLTESRGLLERCLALQQHILNTMDGAKYIGLYASTLLDIGDIALCEGSAIVTLKTSGLALTLLRAVHGDNQREVERALTLQGAAQLFLGEKEKSRESRSQAVGIKQKVDMADLI